MIKIGEGKTATVYSDGTYAYKKYHDHYDKNNIHYEVNVQNEIHNKTNLPVASYEIVDDYIKMTLLDGTLFAKRIQVEKYEHWLEDFTDLQCQTYQYENLELGDACDIYTSQIKASTLDEQLKSNALSSIDKIHRTKHLCHFDFHPLNIIYQNNQYYILDWTNSKLGNPVMDIASTYIIFREYLSRQSNKYLNMMIKKTGFKKSDILDAIPVMAFIKLRENDIPEHEQLLIDLVNGTDKIYQ